MYARVQLTVSFVRERGQPADEVWILDLDSPDWPPDMPVSKLIAAFDGAPMPTYIVEEKRRIECWGGDSSIHEILLSIGTGVVGSATWDALHAAWGDLVDRARDMAGRRAGEFGGTRRLDRREAVETAAWHLRIRYELPDDVALEPAAEEWDSSNDEWSVEFDVGGSRYIVQVLAAREGGVFVGRIRRESTPPGA